MKDSDPIALTKAIAQMAQAKGIAYVHVMRGDFFGIQTGDTMGAVRAEFHGALMGNMGFTPEEAANAVASGHMDLVAFGHHYISNPDLAERVRTGHPLVEPNPKTYYTNGPEGYIDYPAFAAAAS
jgi:N-ethylmaleimide reductase